MEETKKQLKEIERYTEKLKRFITIIERSACVIDENSAKRLAQIQQDIENAHTAIEMAYNGIKLRIEHNDITVEKIPCIKYSKELFVKVRPMLESWDYFINTVTVIGSWTGFKLLVLNYCNTLGSVAIESYNDLSRLYANRELVTDPEEFLRRAAKLKGYEYKSNS